MANPENINTFTDHLFRHESGKMVSVLTKIFGIGNLETAEDVVQQAFIDAIRVWRLKGIPNNPSAWLFSVAKNKAIDIIRKNKFSVQYDFSEDSRILLTSEYTLATTMENLWKEELMKDDLLRMMFACCHPEISEENQITLILKTLCGFSTSEIAKSFLTSEETISKRLLRTKDFFRNKKIKLEIPSVEELKSRTHAVLGAIYLLFNEGYNSSQAEHLIRRDLIEEAKLLCKLLTENQYTQLPEVYALMALMCFHTARSDSRLTTDGEIILLPKQDRSKWNKQLIVEGNDYLNKASFGRAVTAYHVEAAIAFEHCKANTFEDTNWELILDYYQWVCVFYPSPITELNKIVAVMQVHGAEAALEEIAKITNKKKLESYYLYFSILGEIHLRINRKPEAKQYFLKALDLTQSKAERKMLMDTILMI